MSMRCNDRHWWLPSESSIAESNLILDSGRYVPGVNYVLDAGEWSRVWTSGCSHQVYGMSVIQNSILQHSLTARDAYLSVPRRGKILCCSLVYFFRAFHASSTVSRWQMEVLKYVDHCCKLFKVIVSRSAYCKPVSVAKQSACIHST